MKLHKLTTAVLLTTLGLTLPSILVAQNPPAQTYQPGFWQPVARVDLNRPLVIKLVNQTDIPLEYDFTTTFDVPPQPIQPGETLTLKEQIPIPAYLLVNRRTGSTTAANANFNLKFEVLVSEDNTITLTVVKVDSTVPGNTTFNLHETGAIYIY